MDHGIETLEQRAKLAKLFCWLFIALFSVTVLLDIARIAEVFSLEEEGPLLMPATGVYVGASLVFILSVIFVGMWIHRAHANLFDAGLDGLEYTPGWSVGWFFIPIANLFKPFQAMRELWNRSHGEDDGYSAITPSAVGTWWGCYIGGNVLSSIGQRLEMAGGGGMAAGIGVAMGGTLVLLVSAWWLIKIIDAVGQAQRSMMGVAETFA